MKLPVAPTGLSGRKVRATLEILPATRVALTGAATHAGTVPAMLAHAVVYACPLIETSPSGSSPSDIETVDAPAATGRTCVTVDDPAATIWMHCTLAGTAMTARLTSPSEAALESRPVPGEPPQAAARRSGATEATRAARFMAVLMKPCTGACMPPKRMTRPCGSPDSPHYPRAISGSRALASAMEPAPMARLDWDRVRRNQPLDGADARIDPDGAVLWEREVGPAGDIDARSWRDRLDARSGVRRLRAGIVVRRARERREDDAGARDVAAPMPSPSRPVSAFDESAWIECPRCKARIPRRKLLLHARAACTRRG